MAKFALRCTGCEATYDPPRLHCDHCNGLLRSEYGNTAFRPTDRSDLFAFQDWIPASMPSDVPLGTAILESEALADEMGLQRLSIAFSGYAPKLGAENPTGSFKDFEAIPTMLYYREHGIESLVLASAGNTARAFAYAATQLDFPVIIVVPERALERLWIPCAPTPAVRLVVLDGCDDYAEAIRVAGLISESLEIPNEGGARNVARRDGMSTGILEYARRHQGLPAHYFQAIGSGTGAIATWEASMRLVQAGVGTQPPQLHLSQNAPFAPIHEAWTLGMPIDPNAHVAEQLRKIEQIDALVLANRTPPFGIPGGVRDALSATDGLTYAITNAEAREAGRRFQRTEGLAIGPAASVATAALFKAVETGTVQSSDAIMLHITGNDRAQVDTDCVKHRAQPVWRISPEQATADAILAAKDRLLPNR